MIDENCKQAEVIKEQNNYHGKSSRVTKTGTRTSAGKSEGEFMFNVMEYGNRRNVNRKGYDDRDQK